MGTFLTTIWYKSGYVKNITYHVIDANIPPLLGLNFLNHSSIESYFISKNYVILNRKIGNKIFKNKLFFTNPRIFFNSVSSVDQNSQFNRKPPVLPSKIQQAKELLKVSINEKSDFKNAEKVAELLLSFKDVFGVNSKKNIRVISC